MADGSITFSVWLDADEAEKELNSVKKKILELQTELSSQQKVKGGLEERLASAGVAADEAKAKLQELIQAGASPAQIRAQESIVKGLDKEFETAAAAVDKQNAKIDETNAKLAAQSELYGQLQQNALGLAGATDAAGASAADAGAQAAQAGLEAQKAGSQGVEAAQASGSATDALASKLDKMTSRIAGLAKRVLFFSLFTRAFRSFREYVGKALESSDEFTAAMARLKGALATGFQPIFTAVLPAIIALINVLAKAAAMIASFVSMLFGSTVDASAAAAESLNNEADALDAVGGGAAKASKQLASFDQINRLDDSSGGGGGGGGSALGNKLDFTGAIKSQLDELEIYLSGALLALGAILTFTGANIPLGLGLMVVGALGLASALKADWNTMPANIKRALTRTMGILGGAALVIGAILTFSGANLPLGIGLMVAGAAALGTAAALNWNTIKNKLQGQFGNIVAIASAGLLVVGMVLAFSGASLPLGIGLMVAGAVGLASVAALNWEKIKTELQGQFGGIVAIASAGLLVLGLILALSGAALPLGIGLMVAGAAGLATVAALNWDKIKTELQGQFSNIVAIASGGLLVLGLILALSGVALPLGIALMVAGAAGLATVTAINWDAVKEEISGAWSRISAWWSANVAPIFTVGWWQARWNSILSGFTATWQELKTSIETSWNNLKTWWDGLTLKAPTVTGGTTVNDNGFSHSAGKLDIPHLATGAVIPPNSEFLAVLGDQSSGTNIEAPLDTIVSAFRQAMNFGGTGQEITVKVYLDSREIYSGQQSYIRAMGV